MKFDDRKKVIDIMYDNLGCYNADLLKEVFYLVEMYGATNKEDLIILLEDEMELEKQGSKNCVKEKI